jgi:CRP-like cAMP-binding protein
VSEPAKPYFTGAFDRLLYLRTLPLFGTLPPDDLALLATYTIERQFEAGAVLIAEAGRVEAIHLLVDGSVRTSRGGVEIGVFGPRDTVGVLGLLARTDAGVEAVTVTAARTLEIGADALLDLFEDHFSILQHVMSGVASLVLDKRRQILLAGAPEPKSEPTIARSHPLDFVERIFFLRRALPRGFTSVAALAGIARRATELRLEPGALLWSQGDQADAVVIPVSGSIVCVVDGGTHRFRCGPGVFVASSEALAGAPHWYEARVDTTLLALRVSIEDLIDVFDDHFELAMEMLALMARDLLEVAETAAIEAEAAASSAPAAPALEAEAAASSAPEAPDADPA